MFRSLSLLAALSVLCALSGCSPILTSFSVPDSVVTGEVFEIELRGAYSTGGSAAAVLQLPAGAVVLDAWSQSRANVTLNDPAVLALFNPEPGMNLASFSGASNGNNLSGRLRVRLVAPPVSGAMIIKVALAQSTGGAVWVPAAGQPQDFSLQNDPLSIRSIDVLDAYRSDGNMWRDLSEELAIPLDTNDYELLVEDLNADGLDDLVLRSESASGPSVFMRSIFGEWLPSSNGLGAGLGKLVVGDANGDGNRDILCGSGELYLGDGQGSWTGPTMIVGFPGGVPALGDLNGDGLDDVVSGHPTLDQVFVFYSQMGGGFSAAQILTGPNAARVASDIAIRDFDGDGIGDLFLARGLSSQGSQQGFPPSAPSLYLGSLSGLSPMEAPNSIILGSGNPPNTSRLRAEDFDGDGDTDLALYRHSFEAEASSVTPSTTLTPLTFFENRGLPGQPLFVERFAPTILGTPLFLNTTAVHSIDFCDIDGDGDLDGVAGVVDISFGSGQVPSFMLMRNDGGMVFSYAPLGSGVPSGFPGAWDIAAGDFDGDGLGDFCYRFQDFGLRVMKQMQDADYCSEGTVEASLGASVDVLLVDGQAGDATRSLRIPSSTSFTVQLSPATMTPNPRFVIWGELGPRDGRAYVSTPLGAMCIVPHLLEPSSLTRFTLANSIAPDPLALQSPSPGPWSVTFFNGVAFPLVFTLQGVLEDSTSATCGYSVTNAVTVAIE